MGLKKLSEKECAISYGRTAYLATLSSPNLIETLPYVLSGGDVFQVKDKFTSTDNGKGAAGTHGIMMNEGWYQQYEGMINARHETGHWRTFILFSAYTIREGLSAVAGFKKELGDHVYIAYADIYGSLFSCRGPSSTNVAPCKTVQRIELHSICHKARGAYITHEKRVEQSEGKIKQALLVLGNSNRAGTKTAVANITGISREHLSRRYQHLFGKST